MSARDDRGLDFSIPWDRASSTEWSQSVRADGSEPTPAGRPAPKLQPVPERPDLAPAWAGDSVAAVTESLERLQLGMDARFDRLEEQGTARTAALEARIDKLEVNLGADHAASVQAVGLLTGQLLAGLEEQISRVERVLKVQHERLLAEIELLLERRHEELVERLDRHQVATLEAVGGLASGHVVERLLEGIRRFD